VDPVVFEEASATLAPDDEEQCAPTATATHEIAVAAASLSCFRRRSGRTIGRGAEQVRCRST